MTRNYLNRKMGLLAAVALASSTFSAFAYSDGDVIAYFPFDSDFASVVNTDKNPSAYPTFGTVSLVTGDTADEGVRWDNSVRRNTGYLDTVKGRVAIDLSQFGIDENITEMTIEFFAKMADGEVSNWAQQLMFGVLAEDPTGTCSLSTAKPYYLDLERNSADPRAAHFKFQFVRTAGAIATTSVSPAEGFRYDGTWQHVALVYHNNSAGTQGMFDVYVNYEKVGTAWAGNGNLWKGVTLDEGEKLWLFLGREQSGLHCRFDELRISCGALDPSHFLRAASDVAAPKDGDTLMHLKFDGSLASEVHNDEWGPRLLSGTEGYSTDIRSDCIRVYDGDREVHLRNAQCCASRENLKLSCPYWAMQDDNMRSATLEFFIRCNGSLATWATPLSFAGGSGMPMPFIVQVGSPASGDTLQRYYLRADAAHALVPGKAETESKRVTCYVPTTLGHPNDGKWHHVAMTVAERAAGDSEIKFYFDYQLVGGTDENGTGEFAWRGLRPIDYMTILKGQNVDEFRLTKGVLDVEKFMHPLKGLIVVFK